MFHSGIKDYPAWYTKMTINLLVNPHVSKKYECKKEFPDGENTK
jgi:hypothetical protein